MIFGIHINIVVKTSIIDEHMFKKYIFILDF
jgi:hypothetical protein